MTTSLRRPRVAVPHFNGNGRKLGHGRPIRVDAATGHQGHTAQPPRDP
ncbi:hypothetical protein [Streptomyces shenzhenensis]